MTTAVVGAGGATGLECVKKLLSEGHTVKAVVRTPVKYEKEFPVSDNLQIVKGDVTDVASLEAAFEGVDNVIFTASGSGYWSAPTVDFQGVGKTAHAASKVGAKQVVLVSALKVTAKNRWDPIRIILNNIRWGLMDNKFKGEELLRHNGISYTVVRPGGLKNMPGGQEHIIAGQGDTISGSVSRADVAAVCVAALQSEAAQRVTLELISKPEGPPNPPESIFENLKPDA
ncbi:hypothetical protein WJX84_008201 [Apatococcus fuscideae]|uniref:NAD(P)-binding domain-containing protein n=1 Tax=Apatococcus fuscideae TaxID=2026836 RepID=A0AAW1TA78_9CHLO